MVKLVAADMDGTLLNSQKQLPPNLFEVIGALREQGVHFCVASGRQYATLLSDFEPLKDMVYFIAENGAAVYYREQLLFHDGIPLSSWQVPLERIREKKNLFPILCGIQSAYIEDTESQFVWNAKMYYKRCRAVPDVAEAARNDIICKIAVFDKENAETHGFPFLCQNKLGLSVNLSGAHWIDLMNERVSKGAALQALQQRLEIGPAETMAFGDYLNDITLLQSSKFSYAMANAHPDLKRHAAYEAPSNDDNGVLSALRAFFHI